MRGHQLFIPGKASEREVQPTYGTDMRAIETAFNALPTGTGTGRPFVRTSRYRVQVTTARTVPIPHSNWFLWDTVHSTLLYQSSVAAPTLSTFITTTTPVQPLHMAGIASRGTAPVVATATWILYITLNISTTRPVDYRRRADVVLDLAHQMQDSDTAVVWDYLTAMPGDELQRLLVIALAAIDIDQPVDRIFGWVYDLPVARAS